MTQHETLPAPANPQPDVESVLQSIADGFASTLRSPLLHTPTEADLAFESVTFPSADGVPLEGWFIPSEGSDKIVVANHPRWFNRSGLPSHLEPWRDLGAATGNDFEVNFVPDYKILHDAGYNVLAYDLRNMGQSGAANGGVFTVGRFESRDVIGSLDYVRGRPDTRDMSIGLFSRCVGANATMFAMASRPEAFDDVRCMVAPQPLSPGSSLTQALQRLGIPAARLADLDELIRLRTSFRLNDLSPVPWATAVRIPTFLYQVRDDLYTTPADVQAMYDNIPVEEKELLWVEGTSRRWDGYTYFQREPARMLAWFERFMGHTTSPGYRSLPIDSTDRVESELHVGPPSDG